MFTNYEFMQFVESGIAQVIFTFLMVFCIAYLSLFKSTALGKHKGTNTLIAAVMGIVVVVPHILGIYPSGYDPVSVLGKISQGFAILFLGILIALFALTLIMNDPKKAIMNFNYTIPASILLLVYIANALPHLFSFALLAGIIIGLISLILGTSNKTGFYLMTVLIALFIIDWAFGWPNQLPAFLSFIEDESVQAVLIVILIFFLIFASIVGKDQQTTI